ncbi:MAG: PilZ domain-containing protein [Janthinobacterium lividum]
MGTIATLQAERRASTRARSFLGGNIIFNNRHSTLDCIIRNYSASGARLQVPNSHLAPDEFDLHITQKQETRRVRATWRSGDGLGIVFLDPNEADRFLEPADRAHALAVENKTLRKRVLDLTRRLATFDRDGAAYD